MIALVAMQVRVLLFAGLRERAGTGAVELELPDGARVQRRARPAARRVAEGVPVVMAINQRVRGGRRAAVTPATSSR